MSETYAKPMPDEKLLDLARKRLRHARDASAKQREREREDIEFQVGENQWTPEAKQERKGRPMLSIDLVKQPRQLVKNQFTRARMGVNLSPVSEWSDDELAEVLQGIYRRIERDGQADLARGWAFDRSNLAGLGWYRVVKDYDEDADPDGPGAWDQEIRLERILHQENVYVDPAAQKPDFSDARYLFVVAWKSEEQFKEEYPHAEAASGFDWAGAQAIAPDWVRRGDDKPILCAEYWWKHITTEEISDPSDPRRKRKRKHVTVYCSHLNGTEVLETYEWDGKYFPFIPMVGEELQPIDGERLWQGMVRAARDGQRFANFAASSLVEGMSLEPKAPWIIPEGQDEGYEQEWRESNRKNLAALHYKPTTLEGHLVGPPQRSQVDTSRMQLAMMAWQEAKGFVQQTTAVHSYALGEQGGSRDPQSGRAILALQQQTDAGTSHYMDNVRLITLPYEARVILDLIPHVYDRPGRVTSIVTGEDEGKTRRIMLGAPFVPDERGWPQEAPQNNPNAKVYDLTKGRFGIDVEIGRAFQTRLQEGGEMLGEILAKAPALMPLLGATWLEFQDWPGAKPAAEILRKVRDQQYPNLDEGEDGAASPAALKAQIAAMQQQVQMLGMQMQAAVKAIETDQVKAQAKLEETRMKIESEERIAAANNEVKLAIEGMAARMEVLLALQQAAHDDAARHEEMAHEDMGQDKEMAHETALAAAGGRSFKASRNSGHSDEQEEGQEMSHGGSREHSEEERPPMMEAE